jgi:hypothetical protein
VCKNTERPDFCDESSPHDVTDSWKEQGGIRQLPFENADDAKTPTVMLATK